MVMPGASLAFIVYEQIKQWLADNPDKALGIGAVGVAAADIISGGKISNAIFKAYDFLKDYLVQAYEVVHSALGHIFGFVSWITQTFEVDNPKKTLYLSLVFFAMVLGIILIFSGQSWGSGGITEMEKKDFSLGDFSGMGAIGSNPQMGNIPDVTTTTLNPENPPPDLNYTWINWCYTDNDCIQKYEGQTTKCCYPDVYAGYFCQGQCLTNYFAHLDRDACYHPAACYNVNDYAVNVIREDASACINKGLNQQDSYCHGTGDYTSKCCNNNQYELCYGYCTRANTSDNCQNIDDCFRQFEGF